MLVPEKRMTGQVQELLIEVLVNFLKSVDNVSDMFL